MTAVIGQLAPETTSVQVRMLDDGIEAPSYAQPGDAGADLRTTIGFVLAPGERKLVPTGVAIALPFGTVGLIHPRSGLAAKHGITVVNAPGTVDAGYRGEIQVCLLNTDRDTAMEFTRGDRIAQLVIQTVETPDFELVDALPESVRGEGGFGSTGGFTPAAPSEPVVSRTSTVADRAARLTAAVETVTGPIGDRSREMIRTAFILAMNTPGEYADTAADKFGLLYATTREWLTVGRAGNALTAWQTGQALLNPDALAAFSQLYGKGRDEAVFDAPINRIFTIADDPLKRHDVSVEAGIIQA